MKRFVWLAAIASCAEGDVWELPETEGMDTIEGMRPEGRLAPPPAFELEVNNLAAGDYAELHVTGAPPGALLRLVWGRSLGDGPCPAVLGGQCLSVSSPVQVANFASIAASNGEAWLAVRIPTRRTGAVAFQVAAIGATPSLSNPVQRQVGPVGGGLADADNDSDGFTPDDGDCADFDASFRPDATDTVGDGIDFNCDNHDGVDGDADGYGSTASGGTDCADADVEIWPGAVEVCNGADDDCDGVTDPPTSVGAPTWYIDGDADGFGVTSSTTLACTIPAGFAPLSTDCNDAAFAIKPSATELPADGVDQNCDGGELCWADADNDGYRPNGTSTVASVDLDCVDTNEAVSADPTTDCNDNASAVSPAATEACNDSVDNNCNGTTDEGCGPVVTSFTTVGTTTWTVPAGITTLQVLVVGGGGGGGRGRGGGGGGGGAFVQNANLAVTPGQQISVTVGAGGAGGTSTVGATAGGQSAFGATTAAGGGGGGNFSGGAIAGGAGGSGGGGAGGSSGPAGTGSAGVGNNGGGGSNGAGGCYYGGGGGGAGGAGAGAISGCGGGAGAGGAGRASTITGSSVIYAAGGGGSTIGNAAGNGGSSNRGGTGGGSIVNGNVAGPAVVGGAGVANSGSGGGGGGYTFSSGTSYVDQNGGAGGSGVVIIRYCNGCSLPAL